MKFLPAFSNSTQWLWFLNVTAGLLCFGAVIGVGVSVFFDRHGAVPVVVRFSGTNAGESHAGYPVPPRNPFDVSGVDWIAPEQTESLRASTGRLVGVMVFPGVELALTGDGTVRRGESLAGGKLRFVEKYGVRIETDGGETSVGLDRRKVPSFNEIIGQKKIPAKNIH